MLPQLEKVARILAKASKILTEELDLVAEHEADLDVAAPRSAAVEEATPRSAVAGAVVTVEVVVPEDDGRRTASGERHRTDEGAHPRLQAGPSDDPDGVQRRGVGAAGDP
ncbi:hypothetical protein [Streptomyces sp. NPDC092307]|uniref:hypothetical protein n=1 Tax=Streptomyces sp. NPDC092307 TaxID=3366013 RepID=UPI003827F271